MSRSGYSDELDQWALICYRGRVASAIKGARGQAMLRGLAAALDAMPTKRLITHELMDASGEVCTLGALGRARGLDMRSFDYDAHDLAKAFDVADPLTREVMFENDEQFQRQTPEERWQRMRRWVQEHIRT